MHALAGIGSGGSTPPSVGLGAVVAASSAGLPAPSPINGVLRRRARSPLARAAPAARVLRPARSVAVVVGAAALFALAGCGDDPGDKAAEKAPAAPSSSAGDAPATSAGPGGFVTPR